MTYQLCQFNLINPGWLSWVLTIVGLALLVPGAWRLFWSNSFIRFSWANKAISANVALVLFAVGLILGGVGLAALGADYHPPFARSVGEFASVLISEQDPAVKADMNDQPLGDLASKLRTGLYSVRMSPAAARTAITGTYQDAFCGADLVNRICRNQAGKLTCDIDSAAKILRVCAKSDEASCKTRSL